MKFVIFTKEEALNKSFMYSCLHFSTSKSCEDVRVLSDGSAILEFIDELPNIIKNRKTYNKSEILDLIKDQGE